MQPHYPTVVCSRCGAQTYVPNTADALEVAVRFLTQHHEKQDHPLGDFINVTGWSYKRLLGLVLSTGHPAPLPDPDPWFDGQSVL